MLVSVTGAGEIDPAPVEVRSQQHFNLFGCKFHRVFAHVGGRTREGGVAAPAVLPGEVGHNAKQALLAWGCAHGGATVLLALPSSPPQIHLPCLCMAGDLKSSLWLFNRCNPNETRKDTRKDAEKGAESRKPQISIKG